MYKNVVKRLKKENLHKSSNQNQVIKKDNYLKYNIKPRKTQIYLEGGKDGRTQDVR